MRGLSVRRRAYYGGGGLIALGFLAIAAIRLLYGNGILA